MANHEEIHFNLGAWQFDSKRVSDTKTVYFCTLKLQTVMIDEEEFFKAYRKYKGECADD